MDWLWAQDASRDLLLAVHPPNYIVLWNGDTGTKLWKKSYAENILSFSFDPFEPSNLACVYSITFIIVIGDAQMGRQLLVMFELQTNCSFEFIYFFDMFKLIHTAWTLCCNEKKKKSNKN